MSLTVMASSSQNPEHIILSRLSGLRELFSSTVEYTNDTLLPFSNAWATFNRLYASFSAEDISTSTRVAVQSFAATVNVVTSAVLEGDFASDTIHEVFSEEVNHLATVDFKNLSLNDPPPQGVYVPACYAWLLEHLNNPYPTKRFRTQVSKQTGAALRDIDAWFIEARRRMGWNSLRKRHFDTRADMVKAATQFFKRTSQTLQTTCYGTIPPSTDYAAHFAQMEANAQNMYAGKFAPTLLATQIEDLVKNADAGPSSPSSSTLVLLRGPTSSKPRSQKRKRGDTNDEVASSNNCTDASGSQRSSKRRCAGSPTDTDTVSASSLPSSSVASPSASPERPSPIPVIVLSSEADDGSPEPCSGKRKRRISDAGDESDSSRVAGRPGPRRRLDSTSPKPNPTPLTQFNSQDRRSSAEISPIDGAGSPSSSHQSEPPNPLAHKRKRRLSDSDGDRPRKLPSQTALVVPRLHSVSNPLPLSHHYPVHEEAPSTVSGLDLTSLPDFDVETFNYGNFPALTDYFANLQPHGESATSDISVAFPDGAQPFPSMASNDPLVGLDFGTSAQTSFSSLDDIFAGIQKLGNELAQQEDWSPSPSDLTLFPPTNLDQSFNSTSDPKESLMQVPAYCVNPMDLFLAPAANVLPTVASTIPLHPIGNTSSLGNVSDLAFAMKKIQDLQAEINMYQNQLAQSGLVPL